MDKSKKVATLPKHATTSEMRRMLERKARATALAEHLKTRKAVDKLLSKNRRDVKTVDGYKEKAMAKSGTGVRISMSYNSADSGAQNGIFTERDKDTLLVFLGNYYSFTKDDVKKAKEIANA